MGNQIMIALSYVQLVAGSGAPFLSEVKENRSYVPDSWLGHLRTFLCQCKGKITILHAWLPAPQQEHDQILMDVFCSLKPSTLTLDRLNAVCLYLSALTLSDIVTDNGTSIMDWALTGRTRAKTMIPWPNQNKPSAAGW
eukprot:13036641-Ditylum_brightwellii.AAC.1